MSQPPASLAIYLFGPARLECNGQVVEVETRKAMALLAYLALHAERLSRDQLATFLWPEYDQARAYANLRRTLWALNKALGEGWLTADNLTLALRQEEGIWIDVLAFQRLLAQCRDHGHRHDEVCPACLAPLTAAVQLGRGNFLEGFSLDDSAAFDDWQFFEGESLRKELAISLEKLVRWHSNQQEDETAISYARRWLALDPLHEPVHRWLMQLYAWSGQPAAAAHQYQECVRVLQAELDAEPEAKTITLYQRIRTKQIGPRPTPPSTDEDERAPTPGESPYKGLQPFEVGDADAFFGRERLTAELVDHLCHHRFLAIVGASGSGKSSVVRAGLVPALQRGEPLADGILPPAGSTRWPVHLITPTAHPLKVLAASLTGDSESVTATTILMDDLARDARTLDLYVNRILSRDKRDLSAADNHLLIVVDQFEEFFTLCHDKNERKAFVDNLLTAAAPEGQTLVVITLRADYYAQCAELENLRTALERYQRYIGPMTQAELRRAIEEPAHRNNWELEPGLVDLMLADVGAEPGALPLLSHALLETWKHRHGRTLTLAGYAASGRVQGAIAQTADTVLKEHLTSAQCAIARNIFLRLTEPGADMQDTRRRADLDELIPSPADQPTVETVLKILVDTRLVTVSQEEVEVAHEALIREWPTLREWLTENREWLRIQRRLTASAQEWAAQAYAPDLLYQRTTLEHTLEKAKESPNALSELEHRFLQASQDALETATRKQEAARQLALEQAQALAEAQKRRADAQSRASSHLRWLVVALLALCALAVGTGWYISRQSVTLQQALTSTERTAIQSRANELAAYAQAELAKPAPDPSLSLILASMAFHTLHRPEDSLPINVVSTLEDVVRNAPPWRMTLPRHRHTAPVRSATFSPNGRYIVTASEDATARVWDAQRGTALYTLVHTDIVNVAAFSPDDNYIVSASFDKTAKVWGMQSGTELFTLAGHGAIVWSAAFSADGKYIVTASDDTTACVWETQSGQQRFTLTGHTAAVYSAVFSPDGRYIVTASADQTARVWDAQSGQSLFILAGHTALLTSAAFSPDGRYIVTASDDATARVWETQSGKLRFTLADHLLFVTSAAFSPDGHYLLTTSVGMAQLWETQSGNAVRSFAMHGVRITSAAFSADGKFVVTSDVDGLAQVWDVEHGRSVATFRGHTGPIGTVVFSPDGKSILTASADATARVWESQSGKQRFNLVGHSAVLTAVTFSLDGKTIVTASADHTAKVWDVQSGAELLTLAGHTAAVNAVAFSPDGKTIVTASADRTAKLWDAQSGAERLTLAGHTAAVTAAAFSPDGKTIVTASAEHIAKLWDAQSGAERLTLAGHTATVTAAAFSPDGQFIVTASADQTARVWESHNGKSLRTLVGHSAGVTAASFSPDNQAVVTTSQDKTARVWQVETGKELFTLSGHAAPVWSAAFSPDSQSIITASADQTARIWAAQSGKQLALLTGHRDSVTAAAFSPDGQSIATASSDQTARLWEMYSSTQLHTLQHAQAVNAAAFSPDGRYIATAGDDRKVQLWEAQRGKTVLTLRHSDAVTWVAFSPDGGYIATTSRDQTTKVWEVPSGKHIHTLTADIGFVWSVAFSPDGKYLVTASSNKTARVWETQSGELVRILPHKDVVWSAAFSPDGNHIVTASRDGTAKLWQWQGVKTVLTLHHANGVSTAVFSPDGRYIVTTSLDTTAQLWDAQSGEAIFTLGSHSVPVWSAAFSPDGNYIVTASEDGMAQIWETQTGKEVFSLAGHTAAVYAAAFSPDGKYIITASDDATARTWFVHPEDWLEAARRFIQRDPPVLTPEERRRFG